MTILTYEKEEQLLAPIKEYVGSIQAEIDDLREEGTTKATRLQHQLRNMKADRTLSKEERAQLRQEDEQELAKARKVQKNTAHGLTSWFPKLNPILKKTSTSSI